MHFFKNKKVVYTAITAGYDTLTNPLCKQRGWDYICFTDSESLKSDFWKIIKIKNLGLDSIRTARYCKIMTHKILPQYEESLWIDGNFQITGDINAYIKRYSSHRPILCVTHSARNSIYSEAKACVDLKKDTENKIFLQMDRYRKEGYPRSLEKLIESGILYRHHNDSSLIPIMESWWNEVENYSYRDQLSFNYVCWKNNFDYDESYILYHKNEYFERISHVMEEGFERIRSDIFWSETTAFNKDNFKSTKPTYDEISGEFSVSYKKENLENFDRTSYIRFDPSSCSIRFKDISATFTYDNCSEKKLFLLSSNYTSWDEDYMIFNHDDPRFIFDISSLHLEFVNEITFKGILFPEIVSKSKLYLGTESFSENNAMSRDMIIKNDQFHIEFDMSLSNLNTDFDFSQIRFDPADQSIAAKMTSAKVISVVGDEIPLKPFDSNHDYSENDSMYFHHKDPWYKYQTKERVHVSSVDKFVFEGHLSYISFRKTNITFLSEKRKETMERIISVDSRTGYFNLEIELESPFIPQTVVIVIQNKELSILLDDCSLESVEGSKTLLTVSSTNQDEYNFEYRNFINNNPEIILQNVNPIKNISKKFILSGKIVDYVAEDNDLYIIEEEDPSQEFEENEKKDFVEIVLCQAQELTVTDYRKTKLEIPLIDIIVCVHNAFDDVKQCLESLYKDESTPFHLIIVDDGSEDMTKNYLQEFCMVNNNTSLIRNEQGNGYTVAANMGLKKSTSDVVVLLNSDTIVTENWLKKMYACMESREDIGIVGPLSNAASWQSVPLLSDPIEGGWHLNPLPEEITIQEFSESLELTWQPIHPIVPLLNGFCLMIRRDVIDQIGFLDDISFPRGYGEEDDYNIRAQKAGFLLAVADDTYIYHAKSKSYSNEKKQSLSLESRKQLNTLHGADLLESFTRFLKNSWVFESIRKHSLSLVASSVESRTREKSYEIKRHNRKHNSFQKNIMILCLVSDKTNAKECAIIKQLSQRLENNSANLLFSILNVDETQHIHTYDLFSRAPIVINSSHNKEYSEVAKENYCALLDVHMDTPIKQFTLDELFNTIMLLTNNRAYLQHMVNHQGIDLIVR